MKFSPQQIRAIKMSPKGKLPAFISAGVYKSPTVSSVGGRIGKVGAALGYDKTQKKAFGSWNVNGKIKGKFGPQGY